MKIKDLTNYLESIAPSMYQESYDNSGLIVGNANADIKGVMLCLDSTEAVLDEAIEKGCNVVVAHHPIVFKGLKRITGRSYVERVIIKAIKNDVAIYAIHTNLDNVHTGVNAKICEKLGLEDCRILSPKATLKKLTTYSHVNAADVIRNALFAAGAGIYNDVEQTSFTAVGIGTQNGAMGAQSRIEVTFSEAFEGAVVKALYEAHPSGKPVYEVMRIENRQSQIGSGMIGELPKAIAPKVFLAQLKSTMKADGIRYTKLFSKKIKTVAVCGGSGGFLLKDAIRARADIFITADYKYHEFFDADGRIIIADIGHYESEQFTIELFNELITQKFSTFAVYLTKVNTNPISYY